MTRPAPTRARGGKWRLWCGFVSDKPAAATSKSLMLNGALDLSADGYGLFTSYLKAREGYEDVRRVEIREVPREVRARRGAK